MKTAIESAVDECEGMADDAAYITTRYLATEGWTATLHVGDLRHAEEAMRLLEQAIELYGANSDEEEAWIKAHCQMRQEE